MELYYDVSFSYFFYENDSKDNTPQLIREFLKNRNGKLLKEDNKYVDLVGETQRPIFDENIKNLPPITPQRIRKMVNLRNDLLKSIQPIQSDWTLLIDSNIFFDTLSLNDMFSCLPSKNNIGMITPYSKIMNTTHYFDTFAFTDNNGNNSWPYCVFDVCDSCNLKTYNTKNNQNTEIDVLSAFGGFSLIKTEFLNDPLIKWSTVNITPYFSLCEHVLFCQFLKSKFNIRIIVNLNAKNIYWKQTF